MIPKVDYSPNINDLFSNFWFNWGALLPAVSLLLGVFFAFFILRKLKDMFY